MAAPTNFTHPLHTRLSKSGVTIYSVLGNPDGTVSQLATVDVQTGHATVIKTLETAALGSAMSQLMLVGNSLYYNAVNMSGIQSDLVHISLHGDTLSVLATPKVLSSMVYTCNDANAPEFLLASVDGSTHLADVVLATYHSSNSGLPKLRIVLEEKQFPNMMYGIGMSAFSCRTKTLILPAQINNAPVLQFLQKAKPPAMGWVQTNLLPLNSLSPESLVVDDASQMAYFNMYNSTTQNQQLVALSLTAPFKSKILFSPPVALGLSQATGAITFSAASSCVVVALADAGGNPWILSYNVQSAETYLNQFEFSNGAPVTVFPNNLVASA